MSAGFEAFVMSGVYNNARGKHSGWASNSNEIGIDFEKIFWVNNAGIRFTQAGKMNAPFKTGIQC